MEFTRLADVEVVETATDVDKVLIEQNGEIKRVPKTEVGGSGGGSGGGGGGGSLIIVGDEATQTFTANMTLTEAVEAFNKHELAGAALYFPMEGMPALFNGILLNGSALAGFEILLIACDAAGLELFWTADGISMEPPEGLM